MRRIKAFGAWLARNWSGLCAGLYLFLAVADLRAGSSETGNWLLCLTIWAASCWLSERGERKAKKAERLWRISAYAWEQVAKNRAVRL